MVAHGEAPKRARGCGPANINAGGAHALSKLHQTFLGLPACPCAGPLGNFVAYARVPLVYNDARSSQLLFEIVSQRCVASSSNRSSGAQNTGNYLQFTLCTRSLRYAATLPMIDSSANRHNVARAALDVVEIVGPRLHHLTARFQIHGFVVGATNLVRIAMGKLSFDPV